MTDPTAPIVLVDGSSYLYRAFHVPALQRLTAPDGTPTGAIHGVLNMVNRLIADYSPARMAVVFDAKGKTFRNDLYADYKANRPPMPDELRSQIEPTIAAIEALGIRVVRISGVEADDVIGTLATAAAGESTPTVISTTDKDMTQLVNDHVLVLNTMDDRRLDAAGVREKFGVPPDLIIDYLTLVGDTSDNVPGVQGVGPKTAIKWLDQYGSLDGLVEHADDIGGKVGERLRDSLEQLPLFRELVTIKCDVELPFDLASLARAEIDGTALRALLEPLGMSSFLTRTLGDAASGTAGKESGSASADAAAAAVDTDYSIVTTETELDAWLETIRNAELVAVDTETTSLNYMAAEIVGISLSAEPYKAAYIPLAHRYAGAPDQLDREATLGKLKPWLEDATAKKVGHHLKYDAHIFENHGIRLAGIEFDTMLESYVLN